MAFRDVSQRAPGPLLAKLHGTLSELEDLKEKIYAVNATPLSFCADL